MTLDGFKATDILSLIISIISLIISLVVLYLTYFNKRKPVIACPVQMQIRKETIKGSSEPCLVFYIPLVIVNKGSRIIIIHQMVLQLGIQDKILPFICNLYNDKVNVPKLEETMDKSESYFTPFEIGKYMSQSKMFGFGSMRFYGELKAGTYFLKLSLSYDINKKKDYYWRFELDDEMAKKLKESNYAVVFNIFGIKKQIFSIKKKEFKINDKQFSCFLNQKGDN